MSSLNKISKSTGKGKKQIHKSARVEEIENGYLIIAEKEWSDKDGWHNEVKKFYSKDDPFITEERELADYF